jgi:hypothetical protein
MAGENAARRPEVVQAEAKERPKEVVIKLTVPVQAHGETLNEMKFRRPTGKDIMAIGDDYPIHIDWSTGQVRPNPPSTIASMDAEDWSTCAHALMGFFPPGAQAMQF